MEDKDDHIKLEVKNQGPGIHHYEQTHLFKPYTKLSSRPTAGESSIGLGLAITKMFTELLQGKIWCESEFGKGARFAVQIPVN